jgi:hypothetical protein
VSRRQELEAAVAEQQAAVAAAERRVQDLRDELATDPRDPALLAELRAAVRALATSRGALARAQAALAAFLARPPLLEEDAPVVLLPVRLETRFVTDPAGPALLVRIYPDDVHVEDHQPELSDGEVAAAAAYWRLVWRAGRSDPDAERRAFEQLAGRVGVTRAGYVARVTVPDDAARPADPVPEGTPLPAEPVLPEVPRAGAFARAARSRVLPERWTVYGFRGARQVATATGAAVPDALPLGPAPDAPAPADGPPLDDGSRWLVDFDAALAVGMAVRLPMPDGRGLDRLVALGVRAGDDPTASAARLRDLLDGHRFGGGLDLLPPGTPTNNTDAERSGWTRRPDAAEFFDAARAAERDAPEVAAAASALGVAPDALAGVVHAGSLDPAEAAAMHRALWPATLGYVLETFGAPAVDDATVDAARRLFVDAVRGLGPLPLLRVGSQPYGLLPVTAVGSWRPVDPADRAARVVDLLRRLAPEWLSATRAGAPPTVPHVGRPGADADQELLDILARDALSGSYRLRPVRGGVVATALRPLVADLDPAGAQLAEAARGLAAGTGTPPRLATVEFDPRTVRVRRAAVLAGPLSETDPLPGPEGGGPNYLAYLAMRGERAAPYTGPGARTLLRALAQHAAELADADAAVRFSAPASVVAAKAALEPEVVDIVGQPRSTTPARLLARPAREVVAPGVPAGQTVGEFLATATPASVAELGLPHVAAAFRRGSEVRRALGRLATVPSARLDRLARAALDACSHRLDAWLTAVATQRLAEVRGRHPTGAYLGGYGWVEDLRPKPPPRPVTDPPPGETAPLVSDPASAGFVVAPSLPQASTAALLLSGHLSHRGDSGAAAGAFAVDLSSDRVRLATWLLDGCRQGQPLGALLGYRFERGLHDRSRPGLELDRFIRPLRALAPLVAEAAETHEAVESVAASGVVDGLALLRRWQDDPSAVDARLAGAPPRVAGAVRAELAALGDAADAVADLLAAETVYQLATGNLARAAAAADAVGSGLGPPPEPEVVRTPRPAFAYAHRLVTLVPVSAAPAPGWEAAADRPRRLAEPRLDRWVAGLLGPADRIRAAVRTVDAAGAVAVHEVTLADAGACALDVVHGADLELLLAEAVAADGDAARAQVVHRDDPDWPGAAWPADVVPLEDALEQGRWIAETVGTSRPLAASDLAAAGAAEPGDVNAEELQRRATRAADRYQAAARALEAAAADPDRLRAALAGLAAYGVPGVAAALRDARLPGADAGAVLAAAAQAALAEVARVLAVLHASPAPAPAEAIRAVLGPDFTVLPLVTRVPAGWPGAVTAAREPSFLGGEPAAPLAWLQRVATVRAPVERYLLAVAGGGGRLAPVQLPPAARWVALPFAAGAQPPDAATSVLVHGAGGQAGAASVAGFVVDEWTDLVPAASGTAGVAFHVDEPGARAPQAVLLAVPPELGVPWTADTLLEVVRETADLARIRTVGPAEVPWLGRFLPALLVADNAGGDTLGVDVRPLTRAEAVEAP